MKFKKNILQMILMAGVITAIFSVVSLAQDSQVLPIPTLYNELGGVTPNNEIKEKPKSEIPLEDPMSKEKPIQPFVDINPEDQSMPEVTKINEQTNKDPMIDGPNKGILKPKPNRLPPILKPDMVKENNENFINSDLMIVGPQSPALKKEYEQLLAKTYERISKFNGMEKKMLEKTLLNIESAYDSLKSKIKRLNSLNDDIELVEETLSASSEKIESRIAELRGKINSIEDKNAREKFEGRLKSVETSQATIENKIKRLIRIKEDIEIYLDKEKFIDKYMDKIKKKYNKEFIEPNDFYRLLNKEIVSKMREKVSVKDEVYGNKLDEKDIKNRELAFEIKLKSLEKLVQKSQHRLDILNKKIDKRRNQIEQYKALTLEERELIRKRDLKDRIFISGELVDYDVPPVIKDGRTLVPIRVISEVLGAVVTWNPLTKEVKVERNGRVVILTIGSNTSFVNGKQVKIEVPAEIIGDRTFVPLRVISEGLEEDVSYDNETGEIDIAFSKVESDLKVYKDYEQSLGGFEKILE